MSSTSSSVKAVGVMDLRPPFTAAQWQELEHQALIYKYLVAGLSVPPELLVPIQRSLESLRSARFFQHSALGYCSYYGKKIDPEPGRCRRTDGKKWRCSKDAYPDSKYCERHMHRGRNRSRKLVESQSISPSLSSSTVMSSFSGSNGGSGSFQSLPFHSGDANREIPSSCRNNLLKLQADPSPFDDDSTHSNDKEFRYFQGVKLSESEAYEQSLSLEGGSSGAVNSGEDTWRIMPTLNETRQLYLHSDYGSMNLQQQQSILFRNDISPMGKEDDDHHHYAMRNFMDEGATTGNKGLWYDGDKINSSNTRLSISAPEISSPNDA